MTQQELEMYYNQGKTMIWKYKTLYQINPKNNANNQFYLMKLYVSDSNITLRGRFIATTPELADTFLKERTK